MRRCAQLAGLQGLQYRRGASSNRAEELMLIDLRWRQLQPLIEEVTKLDHGSFVASELDDWRRVLLGHYSALGYTLSKTDHPTAVPAAERLTEVELELNNLAGLLKDPAAQRSAPQDLFLKAQKRVAVLEEEAKGLRKRVVIEEQTVRPDEDVQREEEEAEYVEKVEPEDLHRNAKDRAAALEEANVLHKRLVVAEQDHSASDVGELFLNAQSRVAALEDEAENLRKRSTKTDTNNAIISLGDFNAQNNITLLEDEATRLHARMADLPTGFLRAKERISALEEETADLRSRLKELQENENGKNSHESELGELYLSAKSRIAALEEEATQLHTRVDSQKTKRLEESSELGELYLNAKSKITALEEESAHQQQMLARAQRELGAIRERAVFIRNFYWY